MILMRQQEKIAVKGARTPSKKASSAFGGLRSNGARLNRVGALVGAPGREVKVFTMYLNLDTAGDPRFPTPRATG